jgi:RNA polymerase sigma factor (sigma-70 family)
MSDLDTESFLPTRQSLLSRLKDWEDNDSWRDFFETYWRLIYDVARKAGCNDSDAQDIVQETIVNVAKQMGDFRYDPTKGRFKGWLRQITRRRIADQLRKRYREGQQSGESAAGDTASANFSEPVTADLDIIWEREWEQRLAMLALERVKRRVRPEHYQIFDLCVVQDWPAKKVSKALGVSASLIYVTRHRIAAMLKKELRQLQNETG